MLDQSYDPELDDGWFFNNERLTHFSKYRYQILGRAKGAETPYFQEPQYPEEDPVSRERSPSRTEMWPVRKNKCGMTVPVLIANKIHYWRNFLSREDSILICYISKWGSIRQVCLCGEFWMKDKTFNPVWPSIWGQNRVEEWWWWKFILYDTRWGKLMRLYIFWLIGMHKIGWMFHWSFIWDNHMISSCRVRILILQFIWRLYQINIMSNTTKLWMTKYIQLLKRTHSIQFQESL